MRRLGTTDIEITPIGLGCMQFSGPGLMARFYSAVAQPVVDTVVDAALKGGVSWFDTAEMYGRGASERALTTALRGSGIAPGEVRIATKWAPLLRTASNIERSAEARLASLQGYPIDLHQIHLPWGSLSSIPSQVHAMARLCQAGKITSVGVSNFSARQMEAASRILASYGIALAANQVRVSLLDREIERDGVLDAARRLNVTLIAYSPLKTGLLTGRFHEDPARVKALPVMRRRFGGYDAASMARTAPLVAELRAIGKAHGVSATQVALAWVIGFYGDTVVAIPGASKPHQAEEIAAAMHLRLTEKETRALEEVSRAVARK
ncbi:oxidoreductase [Microtetraspora sp. NBRC 13810]|uniref:aldo/keto reductase n=1 Tax=Microtetraspora sp. NBRC 13810 TaxID=3030990 RepID=UPI0024A3B0CF|nr:aldo/keto reductase [Microtetraspora sp. NBRC 13810]GLW05344.1 oxidoreductase [Microtetraspora sp. NBRC 13810]